MHQNQPNCMESLQWVNKRPTSQYRIGDAILYGDKPWSADARRRILSNPEIHSGTIGYQYLQKNRLKSNPVNIPLLRQIVSNYATDKRITLPNSNEVVIHLRLGDGKATLLSQECITNTVKRCLQHWAKQPSRIIVISSFHVGRTLLTTENEDKLNRHHAEQSSLLLHLVVSLRNTLGITCHIRSSISPDDDFAYLVGSKYMILGNGGFSLCASLASTASVCVPSWCIFDSGSKGNFMSWKAYEELMSPRVPQKL